MTRADPSQLPAFALSGNVVDILGRRVFPATIAVVGDRIAGVTPDTARYDTFLLPGFVDAHIHVESSMLPPAEFARMAVVHGTVATASDPHEIANVLGIEGVRYMIDSAGSAALHVCLGAPSCVPATSFETAGGRLDAAAVEALLADPRIGYLSEVMNVPGVLAGDGDLVAKIAAAKRANKPIDGHAPGLRGADCRRYFAAGISTDHECFTYEEAKEKIECGVKILIREGSAARNFQALYPLLDEHPDQCMLCSDDQHPNDLERGHINTLVARAVERGIDPFNALRAACVNPVLHYGLPVGLLRPGDPADLIEVADLTSFRVLRTWRRGRLVARDGETLIPRTPAARINRFESRPRRTEDFAIRARGDSIRVIGAADGQLVTRELRERPTVRDALAQADPDRDLLKIAVVNRYADAPPAVGFVRGFGLRRGAIASSVAHDSHNVVAVGASDADLAQAVNQVIRDRGGLAVVDGNGVGSLPLPIAGLMSDADGYEVARDYASLDRRAKDLGSRLGAPFMTLSFMALLVIPELKLSDRGLFDATCWRLITPFE
ncbi:MAG TPA: adenine deaminase [Tepidisphaeraceae bacterium]